MRMGTLCIHHPCKQAGDKQHIPHAKRMFFVRDITRDILIQIVVLRRLPERLIRHSLEKYLSQHRRIATARQLPRRHKTISEIPPHQHQLDRNA